MDTILTHCRVRDILIGKISEEIYYLTPIKYIKKAINLQQHNQSKKNLLTILTTPIIKISITDLYNYPQILRELGIDRYWKRAILTPTKTPELEFLELINKNNCLDLKIFTNPYKALEWITKPTILPRLIA